MKRLNDHFIDITNNEVGLQGKTVLEIGCGNGSKSGALAGTCAQLFAIDPDEAAITTAQREYSAPNLTYSVGSAETLKFDNTFFDVAIFSLSLHHVPVDNMETALQEARRVLKPDGNIVFLEPGFTGTFFETELLFGASDGDERKEKAAAYYTMLSSKILTNEKEVYDEVTFVFDSEDDFLQAMEPNKDLAHLKPYLEAHNYTLTAQRRINIFSLA
jgi:ubiquinone/menaquinone biosynthesis C-methylase UbiE